MNVFGMMQAADSIPPLPDVVVTDAIGTGWTGLLSLFVAVLVAWGTQHVAELPQRASAVIDGLPAFAKQFAVLAIAWGLTWLGELIQTPLPETLQAFDAQSVQALLAGIGAWAIHAGKKATSD